MTLLVIGSVIHNLFSTNKTISAQAVIFLRPLLHAVQVFYKCYPVFILASQVPISVYLSSTTMRRNRRHSKPSPSHGTLYLYFFNLHNTAKSLKGVHFIIFFFCNTKHVNIRKTFNFISFQNNSYVLATARLLRTLKFYLRRLRGLSLLFTVHA